MLGSQWIGGTIRTVRNDPAETVQPVKRGGLKHRFGDSGHGVSIGVSHSRRNGTA